MFRATSHKQPSIKSISQTLTQNPIFTPISITPSSSSIPNLQSQHKRTHTDTADEFHKDPDSAPRLFVVQPRFRPDSLLKTKLDEALNLANSLEEQRDGFYGTDFSKKELPPHVVVQNPAYRITRAGMQTFLLLAILTFWVKRSDIDM